jgi:hypothetical protein
MLFVIACVVLDVAWVVLAWNLNAGMELEGILARILKVESDSKGINLLEHHKGCTLLFCLLILARTLAWLGSRYKVTSVVPDVHC